jgi:alkylhydroperoxidase/carboxymuconolactone decarboxylase family protein YurZ
MSLQSNSACSLQPGGDGVRFGKSEGVIMAQQPNPARERIRGIVPKMIELSEQVIYGDIWERPGLSKRDRSLIVVAELIRVGARMDWGLKAFILVPSVTASER